VWRARGAPRAASSACWTSIIRYTRPSARYPDAARAARSAAASMTMRRRRQRRRSA